MTAKWLGVSAALVTVAALAQPVPPAVAQPAPSSTAVELHPTATERVLLNPGMGLYAQCGGSTKVSWPADAWWLPVVGIGYFRMDWADVQPHGPDDDPMAYFGPAFDLWVKQLGKRVAIRVMSESMHSAREYCTPKWVFDAGVPGVDHVGLYAKHQVDPVFWDDRYLAVACEFIRKLGAALDGRPGLEFIDIGQIGEWGEMHLGTFVPGRWTSEQFEATGYSEQRYVAAYRRLIDAYAAAFRHTPVFLNVGDRGQINDYAALRGQHFRQDGLNPAGPSANVGELYYKPYADRGVRCNYEFFASYAEMQQRGWDLQKTLEVGLTVPLSYLNTNLYGVNSLHTAPAVVRDLLTDTARRIGFRFGVTKVATRAPLRLNDQRPARLPVTCTWVNRGVAPCYASYAVELGLLREADHQPVARELVYPTVPTTRWQPGGTAVVGGALRIPPGTPAGRYRLAVRMLDPDHGASPIQLDLPPLPDGWHELGVLPAVIATVADAVSYREDFEGGTTRWQPQQGLTAAVEAPGREGGHAWHAKGAQPSQWNVAAVHTTLSPGGKYRLTAWVKVGRWSGSEHPTLKAGCNRSDGSWITNFNTNAVDLKRPDQWQKLSVTFEAPFDAASVDLALEKGGQMPVEADFWLDDILLELLEGA